MIVNYLGSIAISTEINYIGLKSLYMYCAQYNIGAMTQDIFPSSREYYKWDLNSLNCE